ncbi:hypothetical protein [Streptomyces sp. NPDC000880]
MPVTLDKTPEPRPEDMDRAPAYRPQLAKLTALFFVIADDEGQWAPDAAPHTRDVLCVERAATHDVERAMQKLDILNECDGYPGIGLVELYAVSAAHAAGLARRAYFNTLAVTEAENAAFGRSDA